MCTAFRCMSSSCSLVQNFCTTNVRGREDAGTPWGDQELSAGVTFAAAGIGGLLYWISVYPIDVVKSAIMTDSIIPSQRQYPDILTTVQVRAFHLFPPFSEFVSPDSPPSASYPLSHLLVIADLSR